MKQYSLLCKENPNNKFEKEELYINDKKITSYVFEQDYYYLMGDNRHASHDSRYWGFVPKKNLIGKMVTFIGNNSEPVKLFP